MYHCPFWDQLEPVGLPPGELRVKIHKLPCSKAPGLRIAEVDRMTRTHNYPTFSYNHQTYHPRLHHQAASSPLDRHVPRHFNEKRPRNQLLLGPPSRTFRAKKNEKRQLHCTKGRNPQKLRAERAMLLRQMQGLKASRKADEGPQGLSVLEELMWSRIEVIDDKLVLK